MKVILLRQLIISNFKGIKSLTLNFDDGSNYIHGQNGSGKSTIADAWRWLLTGKDSFDRKDFEIKPIINAVGERLSKVENEVIAVVLINNEIVELKRVHREIWKKKNGEKTAQFAGNETIYFWNEVPLKAKEYQDKLDEIIPEDQLKLLIDAAYFNQLPWQKRRSVLINLAGTITDEEIINSNPSFLSLMSVIHQHKTFEEYSKELSVKIKKAKEEIVLIPSRVDEVTRSCPTPLIWDRVKETLVEAKKELATIDAELLDANTQYNTQNVHLSNLRDQLNIAKNRCNQIEFGIKQDLQNNPSTEKVAALQQQLLNVSQDIKNYKDGIIRNEVEINKLEKYISDLNTENEHFKAQVASLGKDWKTINAQQFELSESDKKCPCCQREFEGSDYQNIFEELKVKFSNDKISKLKSFQQHAEVIKSKIEFNTASITREEANLKMLKEGVQSLQSSIVESEIKYNGLIDSIQKLEAESKGIDILYQLNIALADNEEYKSLNELAVEIQSSLDKGFAPVDNTLQIARKSALVEIIEKANNDLNLKVQIDAAHARIEELKESESILAQQIADLENIIFLIQSFNKVKMTYVEDSVNSKFQLVKFRLFDTQINGAEIPVCDTLINGVPFADANTASKINAGLDIINTLSQEFNISFPVFLDNRESVSEIIETNNQIINLIVDAKYPELQQKGILPF